MGIRNNTIDKIRRRFSKTYHWALGSGRDLPNAYVLPKREKQFRSGRPIVSFFSTPFRPMYPMSNCIAKPTYQLPFPHNLARGDVFDRIQLLKNLDVDQCATPQMYNQDLAGFFASIDTERFVDSWRLTLQYLSSTMSTDPDEILSVKPTPGNTAGDQTTVIGSLSRTLTTDQLSALAIGLQGLASSSPSDRVRGAINCR
jgi:hypothetical protein